MIVGHVQILVIVTLLKCGSTQNLFNKFLPGVKYRIQYQQPNVVRYGYVPLYIIKGPDPASDYMVNHFQPKKLVKRLQNPFRRMRRQVDEDKQFQDLLDSFGGMSDTSVAKTEVKASEDSEVMSNPESGFYFLLDWNSFLEVDNQSGRRVNLRIQPRIGDPKRFLSVSVP